MLTTIAEIYEYFLQGVWKHNSGTVTPEEFDVLYNAAVIDYIRQMARVAETNQRVLDTLRELVPPLLVIPNAGVSSSEQESFPLPYVENPAPGQSHGYLSMLSVGFRVFTGPSTPAVCKRNDGWAPARILRRDQRYDVERDPFSRSSPERPMYYFTGRTMKALCGVGNFANEARIEYIKYPVKVSVVSTINPDLPATVNQEIAEFAVRRQLETIESRRYQTHLNERKINS